MTTCASGHKLKSFSPGRTGFSCDVCHGKASQYDTMFGCRECNYDLCGNCNRRHDQLNKYSANCKNGHKLKVFVPGRSGFGCDGCSKSLSANAEIYGCRICNYDLCNNCCNKNKSASLATKKKNNNNNANANANCEAGHELKKFIPRKSGFGCDGCGRSISPNETLYGCRKCNYDLCETCHQHKNIKSLSSQQNGGKSNIRCPNGHSLIGAKNPYNHSYGTLGWICNQCRQGFLSETVTFHCRACQYDLCKACHEGKKRNGDDEKKQQHVHRPDVNNKSVKRMIQTHQLYIQRQEGMVNAIIQSTQDAVQKDILTMAKESSIETVEKLMYQILSNEDEFLRDIILIENLFNKQYTQQQRKIQKSFRQKYASNMAYYENKPKPVCNYDGFNDLIMYAKCYKGKFKDLISCIIDECGKQKISIKNNSGAKEKDIERAFYKAFYVYSFEHEDGHKQLTDLLRCSLVFTEFEDLYKCFAVIKDLTNKKCKGGIVRCKDRFDPQNMPFGYRDLLINVNCPGSEKKIPIVCEIQLHHKLFYQYKKISHSMYKKARLFDLKGHNIAYEYADKYMRRDVGDRVYQS